MSLKQFIAESAARYTSLSKEQLLAHAKKLDELYPSNEYDSFEQRVQDNGVPNFGPAFIKYIGANKHGEYFIILYAYLEDSHDELVAALLLRKTLEGFENFHEFTHKISVIKSASFENDEDGYDKAIAFLSAQESKLRLRAK